MRPYANRAVVPIQSDEPVFQGDEAALHPTRAVDGFARLAMGGVVRGSSARSSCPPVSLGLDVANEMFAA